MIVRIVKMSFKPEEIDTFLELFESKKLEIRRFPGNLYLELLQDTDNPSQICTYSHWENAKALDNYRHSELFKVTWAETKVLFSEKPEAWSSERIEKLT